MELKCYNNYMEETILEKTNKKWKGTITFENFKINSRESEEIDLFLRDALEIDSDVFNEKISKLSKEKSGKFYNQIVLSGRTVLAMLLNAETTYTGAINYGLVGSGSTAVSDSDIKLVTELKRKGIATRSRTGDSISYRFYYSKADFSGTVNEFGTVIDGTGTADTGQLFNRVLTGGWTKSLSEALTVTVQFDLNPA